jgi:ATP-binding cassette, subfamily A (ABC1), member 3
MTLQTASFVKQQQGVVSLAALPYRLGRLNWKLAVGVTKNTPELIQARDNFVTWLDAAHPPLNGSTIPFITPAMKSLYVPPMSSVISTFDTDQALFDYVRSRDYGASDLFPRLYAAIMIDSAGPNWNYSIRMNFTDTPSTFRSTALLQRGADLSRITGYAYATPQDLPARAIDSSPLPGFSSLQLALDRFILNKPVSAVDLGFPDITGFAAKVLGPLAATLPLLVAELTALAAQITTNPSVLTVYAALVNWLAAERYAPNSVAFAAFPIVGFVSNGFYRIVQNIFPFFFVLCQVFPLAMLLRGIVSEKEAKLREALKMMGLDGAALTYSWVAQYLLIFLFQSVVIALIGNGNMFRASGFVAPFLLFFLFGISSVAFIVFVSVFFTKAKMATTVGVLLFLGLYFVYTGTESDDIDFSLKLASALASPTAFSLGIKQVAVFEDQGVGIQLGSTSGLLVRNWTFDASIAMMAFDTVLYMFLAWYADEVLPSSWREFGIPRPFYFPFTGHYWREVCGYSTSIAAPVAASKEEFVPAGLDNPLFEKPGAELLHRGRDKKCVSVRKLRKHFGNFKAVKDIDLDCYEGQITVILGHNGAGKSTTFNMLTGLLPPTHGGAQVYGKSIGTEMNDIRHSLGVCPQHDVLWPALTVMEHLQLFAEVKLMAHDKIKPAIDEAIKHVGLTEKVNVKTAELSGGQKRKLSVAIALLGDPKLVILDEPTSGMDPYSRRSTWDMLRTAREGRTILLTTHFLDEADLLGDRIAIMAHGDVKCCGSPLFLKSKLGAGYEMTIVKRQVTTDSDLGCDAEAIVASIHKHVPDAKIASSIGAEMRVNLPLSASKHFPGLFDEFDADMKKPDKAQTFGITTYGVSVTSIEAVFLAVASDEFDKLAAAVKDDHAEDAASPKAAAAVEAISRSSVAPAPTSAGSPAHEHVVVEDKDLFEADAEGITHATMSDVRGRARKDTMSCHERFIKHFWALMCKRASYQMRDFRFVCCSILLPGILVIAGLGILVNSTFTSWPTIQLTTNTFNVKRSGRTFSNLPNRVPYMQYDSIVFPEVANSFPSMVLSNTTNVTSEALAPGVTILNKFNFFNETAVPSSNPATAVATNANYQLQRMSTYLLLNRNQYEASRFGAWVFGRDVFPGAAPSTFSLASAPQATLFVNTTAYHAAPIFANRLSNGLAKALGTGVQSITAYNQPLPFTQSQALLFGQFGALSAAIIVVIAFAFVSLAPISFIVRERETSVKHQQQLAGVSIASYWLSSFLWDVISYLIPMFITIAAVYGFNISEFTTADGNAVSAFYLMMFLYGTCNTAFAYAIGHLFTSHTTAQIAVQLTGVVSMILVIASFVMGFIGDTCRVDRGMRFLYRLFPGFALGNGLLQLSFLSTLPVLDETCDSAAEGRPFNRNLDKYDAYDNRAAGYNILYLGVGAIVYLLIAILVDLFRNNPSWQALFSCTRTPPPTLEAEEDDDVAAERRHIMEGSEKDLEDDVVQLRGLTMTYPGGKKAVRNLSFGVRVGQVFGFLGINGAGKTSTLKILSGDQLPSSGGATIAGWDILKQQDQVRRLLGYCPQFDALLDLLTVREHLMLYARIKGVPEKMLDEVVRTKMTEMDLTQYENRVASALSGGNRRKLSMAIALVSEPPVVFADEPSTGMDPKARRSMWKIILRIARSKATSVVLTSHSMEEVEALCSRVGIMVGGRLRCLGSIQHLKNKFGKGWMVEVRQKSTKPAEVEAMAELVRSRGVVVRVAEGSPESRERVGRGNMPALFAALGHPEWETEVNPLGSGWMVHSACEGNPGRDAPLDLFAQWLAEQERATGLTEFVTAKAFKPSGGEHPRLVERHGLKFRFRVPPQDMSLGDMFRAMEGGKASHFIADYSIGQTSLEQVFNQFAAEQEEETGAVAGMVRTMSSTPKARPGTPSSRSTIESPLTVAKAPRG